MEKAKRDVADLVTKRMLVITVYFLADKLGLKDEALTRACMLLNRTFTEVDEGRITIADIKECLKGEYGLGFKVSEVV